MPINRGCVTRVTGSEPSDIVFSGEHARVLMTVTPEGKLKFGPDVYPLEVAELLVREFGRAYESGLGRATERAVVAEARAASLKHQLTAATDRADRAESKANVYSKQVDSLERRLQAATADLLGFHEQQEKRHGQ